MRELPQGLLTQHALMVAWGEFAHEIGLIPKLLTRADPTEKRGAYAPGQGLDLPDGHLDRHHPSEGPQRRAASFGPRLAGHPCLGLGLAGPLQWRQSNAGCLR